MSENKTSKYLKYAIGEILLVVIGILIALQINNWNEQSKNERRALELMQNLKTDLQEDLNQINDRRENIAYRLSLIKLINKDFYIDTLITKIESIDLDTVQIHPIFYRPRSFRSKKGTYSAMVANGEVKLISNRLINLELQEIYEDRIPSLRSIYSDLKRREDVIGWKYTLEKNTMSMIDFFVDHPNKNQIIADFTFYFEILRLYNWQLEDLQKKIQVTIDAIDQELKGDES